MIGTYSVPLRKQLLLVALFACVGAAALLPLCAEDRAPDAKPLPRRPHPASEALVRTPPGSLRTLARDPFMHAQQKPAVPDALIAGASAAPPHPFTVVAVATGESAHALVAQDGATRVVSAGDRLNGIRIASVVPAGVRLDDGTLIRLEVRP